MRRLRGAVLALGLSAGCLHLAPAVWAFSWPQEAARLEAQLTSEDPNVRLGAARRLARLTPASARSLILRTLEDPDIDVRLAALQAALALDVRGVGDRVVPWLQQRETRARVAAVEALFHDPDESAIGPLGRVLADADPRVRRGAAVALGEMGRVRPRAGQTGDVRGNAAAQLLGRLDDADAAVRVAVIDSLARLGDRRAVLPLVSKIQDTEVEVRIAVVRALGVIGDPRASSAVLLAARDRDGGVRVQAARALAVLRDPGAIPALVALSEDAGPVHVRRAALVALSPLCAGPSPHRTTALDRLVRALGDPRVAVAAEQSLTSLGTAAGDALVGCLERTTGAVNAACARVLARVQPDEAVDAIRRALEQGSVSPGPALEAVGHTRAGDALILALEHLTHPEPAARTAALDAVVRSLRASGGDPRAAGPLLAALQEGDWSVQQRIELIESLGWTGEDSVGPALARALASTSARLQLTALVALGRVPGHGQDAVLLTALDHADGEMRRAAALSLRSSGSADSTHELLTRLESREGQDREALALALAGPLGADQNPLTIERARRLIPRMPPPARDSLIEALSTTWTTEAGRQALAAVAGSSSPGDRAKVAEVLAFYRGGRALLARLAEDDVAMVRAHAAWSLGAQAPDDRARESIRSLLADPNAAVVVNAFSAIARWIGRRSADGAASAELETWRDVLCAALEDGRAAVRVNAIGAMSASVSSCPAGLWARLLRSDPAEEVRAAVARALASGVAESAGARDTGGEQGRSPEAVDAAFELRRCSAFERSRRVASTCDAALGLAQRSADGPARAVRAEAQPLLVYVAARRASEPAIGVPFLAMHGDRELSDVGVLRSGWTDRRGAFGVSLDDSPSRLLEPSLLRGGQR